MNWSANCKRWAIQNACRLCQSFSKADRFCRRIIPKDIDIRFSTLNVLNYPAITCSSFFSFFFGLLRGTRSFSILFFLLFLLFPLYSASFSISKPRFKNLSLLSFSLSLFILDSLVPDNSCDFFLHTQVFLH